MSVNVAIPEWMDAKHSRRGRLQIEMIQEHERLDQPLPNRTGSTQPVTGPMAGAARCDARSRGSAITERSNPRAFGDRTHAVFLLRGFEEAGRGFMTASSKEQTR